MMAVIKRALVPAMTLALALPGAAMAAPNDNDGFNQAQPLDYFQRDTPSDRTNAAATTLAGEPFTVSEGSTCDGEHVSRTIWYQVPGNGGPVTVQTRGSEVDTVIVVYDTDSAPASPDPSFDNAIDCRDDIRSGTQGDRDSEVTFPTQAGVDYLVQVGACDDCPGTVEQGTVEFVAYDAPANDNRAQPASLAAGAPTAGDNIGATLETGTPAEAHACGAVEYDRTVWYRYRAPRAGRAIFTSSGIDTVLSVYRGAARLQCNDDGPGQSTASRVEVNVTPGDYLVQVGGIGTRPDAAFGTINMQVEFIDPPPPLPPPPPPPPDLDKDNDLVNDDIDCDDNNPAISQRAKEIRGNSVDEDCVGGPQDYERIGSGYGYDTLPGHVVRFKYVRVLRIPAGATLRMKCRGKGCKGRKSFTRKFTKRRGRFDLTKRVKQHRLRKGARLEIRVTVPGAIGRVFVIKALADGDSSGSDRCLRPGAKKTIRCRS